jgi:hypothetical protein
MTAMVNFHPVSGANKVIVINQEETDIMHYLAEKLAGQQLGRKQTSLLRWVVGAH